MWTPVAACVAPGPRVTKQSAGAAGELAVGVGGVGGRALVAAVDDAERVAVLVEPVEQREVGLAGHAERELGAVRDEPVRQHLSARPHFRDPTGGERATVRGDVAILHRDLRASDHDRERAVAFLKAHYADGPAQPTDELAVAQRRGLPRRRRQRARVADRRPARGPAPPPPPRAPDRRPGDARGGARRLARDRAARGVARAAAASSACSRFVAVSLLAPLWIPLVLAFVAYRLIRTRRLALAEPQRHHGAAVVRRPQARAVRLPGRCRPRAARSRRTCPWRRRGRRGGRTAPAAGP